MLGSSWFPVTCYGQFAFPVYKELNVCKHVILQDVRYGALSQSVTVFPFKTRFMNTSAAILMYFVNTTLRNKHFNAYLYLTSIPCKTQNNKITLLSTGYFFLSGYVIAIDGKR